MFRFDGEDPEAQFEAFMEHVDANSESGYRVLGTVYTLKRQDGDGSVRAHAFDRHSSTHAYDDSPLEWNIFENDVRLSGVYVESAREVARPLLYGPTEGSREMALHIVFDGGEVCEGTFRVENEEGGYTLRHHHCNLEFTVNTDMAKLGPSDEDTQWYKGADEICVSDVDILSLPEIAASDVAILAVVPPPPRFPRRKTHRGKRGGSKRMKRQT